MISNEDRKLHLGFDIDGVIANFAEPFTKIVEEKYGTRLNEADIYTFDLSLILGVTKAERNQLVVETLQKDLPANPEAREVLQRLYREGHKISLLTARYGSLLETTKAWLNAERIPYTQLLLLNVGAKYLARIDTLDLIVEDSLEDAIEWTQKVKTVLIYDHPWNKSLNVKNLIKRVHGWNEIYQEVQKLKAVPIRSSSYTNVAKCEENSDDC